MYALASVLHGFTAWSRRRKAARIENRALETLASLDEYLLRDIGATRADVERLVREGRR
jgi:uncharacterized protein YjiS (DUF1127 family)